MTLAARCGEVRWGEVGRSRCSSRTRWRGRRCRHGGADMRCTVGVALAAQVLHGRGGALKLAGADEWDTS